MKPKSTRDEAQSGTSSGFLKRHLFWFVVAAWGVASAILYTIGDASPVDAAKNYDPLTTLVSALAFGGLLKALWLQQEELSATRDEMAGQREAMERQAELLAAQSTTNHFMTLLESHRAAAKDQAAYPTGYGDDGYLGPRAFEWAASAVERRLSAPSARQGDIAARREVVLGAVRDACFSGISDFTAYFRTLDALIAYTSRFVDRNRGEYWSMIRSRFSQDELRLLYWYCIAGMGSSAFTTAVVDHHLVWGVRPSPEMRGYLEVMAWDRPLPVYTEASTQ